MPRQAAPLPWGETDNQLLYTAIENVSKTYTTMAKARTDIINDFNEANDNRNITQAELEVQLKRMLHIAGTGVSRPKLISNWPEYKNAFVPGRKITKLKFKSQSGQRLPSVQRGSPGIEDSSDNDQQDPALGEAATSRGQETTDIASDGKHAHQGGEADHRHDARSDSGSQYTPSSEEYPTGRGQRADKSVANGKGVAEKVAKDRKRPQELHLDVSTGQAPTVPASVPDQQPDATRSTGNLAQEDSAADQQQPADVNGVPGSPKGTTTWELSPKEARFMTSLRALKDNGSGAYYALVDPRTIRHSLKKSLVKLSQGIESFLKAHPAAVLTSKKMTDGAFKLTRHMFAYEDWSTHRAHLVELLGDGASATLPAVLQAFGVAAIHDWVLNGFGTVIANTLAAQQKDMFNILRDKNADFFEDFRIFQDVEYMENVIKPSLPGHAHRLQQDLFVIIRSLCAFESVVHLDHKSGTAAVDDFKSRGEHYKAWQKYVTEAFQEVLELRLRMEQGSWRYYSMLPKVGDPFVKYRMQVAHVLEDDVPEGSRVYLCLRPIVLAFPRKGSLPEAVVVEAMVTINDAPLKVAFSS